MSNKLNKFDGYILYIDILGYTDIIKSKNKTDIDRLRDFVLDLTPKKLLTFLDKTFDGCNIDKFNIKYFSDNIYIFYQESNQKLATFIGMCAIASFIQSLAIERGFMTRGSLIYSENEFDRNIVFGKAVIEATELEKYNLSPSICLSPSLKEYVNSQRLTNLDDVLNPFTKFHRDDREAMNLCLNGIQLMLNRLTLQKCVKEETIKKHEWLIGEFNRYFKLKIKKKILRRPSSIFEIVDDINYGVWS